MKRSTVGGLLFIGGTPTRLAAFGISDELARLTAPLADGGYSNVRTRQPLW